MVTTNIREIYSFTQKDVVAVVEGGRSGELFWFCISALYFDLNGSNNLWLSFNLHPFWTKLNICVDDADALMETVTIFGQFHFFLLLLLSFPFDILPNFSSISFQWWRLAIVSCTRLLDLYISRYSLVWTG